jgi:hypothetical protein
MSLGRVAATVAPRQRSMLSLGFECAQLDIGYRDRWLSPSPQAQ